MLFIQLKALVLILLGDKKMKKKTRAILGAVMGILSFIAFGYFTNVWAAVALFFAMFADNIQRG